jgi:hypothetical protein
MIEELHDKPWWKGPFILEYRTATDPANESNGHKGREYCSVGYYSDFSFYVARKSCYSKSRSSKGFNRKMLSSSSWLKVLGRFGGVYFVD